MTTQDITHFNRCQ